MIRQFILALLTLIALVWGQAAAADEKAQALPRVSAGTIVDLGVLQSRYADPRRVVVWLPSSYRPEGPEHAVLYMHDGQNLFDTATAGYGMEWQVDETLERLIRESKVRPTIVVGIWNTPRRLREYVPSKAFHHLPPAYMGRVRKLYGGDPLSDRYLNFIVHELRPMINTRFSVKRDAANNAIMGSSMGALISLYAINEYPQLFGGAGMVSTHWPLFIPAEGSKSLSDEEYEVISSAFERYLEPVLPTPGRHRLYFDHGTEMLDAHYERYQRRIDAVVARRGFRQGVDWISRNFPGDKHDEISWASRLEIPLRFLLRPEEDCPRRNSPKASSTSVLRLPCDEAASPRPGATARRLRPDPPTGRRGPGCASWPRDRAGPELHCTAGGRGADRARRRDARLSQRVDAVGQPHAGPVPDPFAQHGDHRAQRRASLPRRPDPDDRDRVHDRRRAVHARQFRPALGVVIG